MDTTIKISADQLAVVNDLLSGRTPCYEHDGFVLVDLVEYFTDGFRVNVKVVSGGAKGTQDACLPYCDVVLFDEGGNEVDAIGIDRAKLDGEYRFNDDDDHTLYIEED